MRCFKYECPLKYSDIRICKGSSSSDRRKILNMAYLLDPNFRTIDIAPRDYDSYILLYTNEYGEIISTENDHSCVDKDSEGNSFRRWVFVGGCRSNDGLAYYDCNMQYANYSNVEHIKPDIEDLREYVASLPILKQTEVVLSTPILLQLYKNALSMDINEYSKWAKSRLIYSQNLNANAL